MALGGRGPEAASRTRRVAVAAAVALFAAVTFVLGLWHGPSTPQGSTSHLNLSRF
jgi:ABC-type Co2+ transport system permease subunit